MRHGDTIGGKKTPEYDSWRNMRRRCSDPNNIRFHTYGGRGIKVCKAWATFEIFLQDMGRRPGSEYSIERIDNDGDYEPGNCKWATKKEQARNRSSSRIVEYQGKLMSLAEAAEIAGIKYEIVRARFYRLKWSVEKCLNTVPLVKNRSITCRI